MASLNDIRSTFLNYFEKQGHAIVASSPLVPRNDPTLLFANSGMVQFKNLFTGLETRDYARATTSQKCVRAGGKHNDLDNVGYTARHHTFFEAWELLTEEFQIPKDKLLVTVYHTDDEAANIWKKVAGLSDDRIIRIATDDNFWRMGPTGPCGPCTEIFFDHGEHIWGGPPGSPEEDGDRFIEIWNIGALLQGKHDNYDTDLMRSLIEASADATSVDPDGSTKTHHRVIADHLRSTSFLIADGVMPANDGRGYVLRRIMRRAMRHAHLLGAKDPLMHRLVPALVRQMGAAFPELGQAQALIEETLRQEETRFKKTLDRGLKLLDDELVGLPEGDVFSGEAAFKLYDTYGFPLDLTQDALREKGRAADVEGFNKAMDAQKAKARAAWSGTGEAADSAIWFDIADSYGTTDFLGYDTETAEGQIVTLVQDGAETASAKAGDEVQIILNQTPFYGESGGQVGDQGVIKTDTGMAHVSGTSKSQGVFIHTATVKEGEITKGSAAVLEVEHARRNAIRANHSATHLLHEALRDALGEHVAQRGSLNAEDRLRFDFSHGNALSLDEISRVERDVNSYIRQNASVVVSMGVLAGSGKGSQGDTYSLELCGGTHVRQTGDIGAFVLLGDSASSAGVRRIEALTGQPALDYLRGQDTRLAEIALDLKAPAADAVLSGVSGKDLPALIDEHKARIGSGAVVLIADAGGKAAVAAGVTEDCTGKISAVDLVKTVVAELGGKGGGGRPDMAQGGGKDFSNAEGAMSAARKLLEG